MKHITKILAVVMAIVLFSGQMVYAYSPPQPLQRLQDLHRKVNDKIIEGLRRIAPYARKIVLYSVPPVAIGVIGAKIARDPALRDKIREGARNTIALGAARLGVLTGALGVARNTTEESVAGKRTALNGLSMGIFPFAPKISKIMRPIPEKPLVEKEERIVGDNQTARGFGWLSRGILSGVSRLSVDAARAIVGKIRGDNPKPPREWSPWANVIIIERSVVNNSTRLK